VEASFPRIDAASSRAASRDSGPSSTVLHEVAQLAEVDVAIRCQSSPSYGIQARSVRSSAIAS
jgi:hypothetical protein